MTTEVPPSAWRARYPDLAGKVAVLAGASSVLVEVAHELCRNGVTPALVIDDRTAVTAATDYADEIGVASLGIVADPADRDTWQRVGPHIEQRLGPIDIAVVIAPEAMRALIVSVLMPDMAARRRGVIIEAGTAAKPLDTPEGLRHRAVSGGSGVMAGDIATAVTWCASDVLAATEIAITLS